MKVSEGAETTAREEIKSLKVTGLFGRFDHDISFHEGRA